MFGSYEYFGLSTTMRNMLKRKQTGIAIIKNQLLLSTLKYISFTSRAKTLITIYIFSDQKLQFFGKMPLKYSNNA